MLPAGDSYDSVRAAFRWQIPSRFNIGVACCDAWADGSNRLALLHLRADGRLEPLSFDALKAASNRLANALRAQGIARGDRIGVLLPQVPEAAIAHLAAYKLGAIAVPLFQLFGEDALEYRLRDCGAAALVTDATGLAKLAAIRARLPALRLILSADGAAEGALDLHGLMACASDAFTPVDTAADDPALIIYTSGTTGAPKGALHAHRVLLGHLPGVEMPQELFPKPGDLFWTPADWAWIGGLLDVLLPSLFHGVPVLAHRMAKFDPDFAFRLMAEHGVRNAFLPPTALKLLRGAPPAPGLRLRSIGSGGETLGAELLDWGRATFGCAINEFYGQTECNLVVSNCSTLMPIRPGRMGRPVPGHAVAVLDAAGRPLPPGEAGTVAIRRPDPVMFLGYWNNPEATAAKFIGDWLLTGDQAVLEEDGYLRFLGRDDDVITSAGYRIGPGEIEDCLTAHPAVAMAAVIGLPDALRTEIVTAIIVPKPGIVPDAALAAELQAHVRQRVAGHAYPRRVEFVEALPLTATGKIMRGALRRQFSGGAAP
ncbi:acyl-CoA synthetase [Siccirubricoccus sp. KC 17139]|uniref:Acyl-CoA synthetase n=1 Tax=Siccirubricoccus soli TaxID=2899147 RepID=A0ABT1D6V4_9PROT|nr:acyl-CoA synthetase [Siccirubricoccus soli]MCO6417673.1 acyl-CoA synthetase [Siccirubricoccus soli]MCP2683808.1 acyl-CoA synthetase [Siccirubricoccus soli]